MATEHRDIPDSQRHEPKGISTVPAGQVYRSDGSASGSWKDDVIVFGGVLADVSEASYVLIPVPVSCDILSVKAVLNDAITIADSNVTISRGGDDALIASLVIAYTSSDEGTTFDNNSPTNFSIDPSTHNYIKVTSDGGSTTSSSLYVSFKAKVTE